jgi:hypothetical protein
VTEQDRPVPVDLGIPGWEVTYDADGRMYVAVRREKLTDYQCGYGAVPEVDARTELELRLLCSAQQHLAEVLAVAEEISAPLPRLTPGD